MRQIGRIVWAGVDGNDEIALDDFLVARQQRQGRRVAIAEHTSAGDENDFMAEHVDVLVRRPFVRPLLPQAGESDLADTDIGSFLELALGAAPREIGRHITEHDRRPNNVHFVTRTRIQATDIDNVSRR